MHDPSQPAPDPEITMTLSQMAKGEPGGRERAEQLMLKVYDELRRLARSYLNRESGDRTLESKALVHEAYLRLVDQDRVNWQGRTHFFAIGAKMMRRLLVDRARKRGRIKHGGQWQRVTLDGAVGPFNDSDLGREDILALHDCLGRLAELDPREAQVVELRFFAGLEVAEVAEVLGVSKRTVESDWTHARAWLKSELARGPAREDSA